MRARDSWQPWMQIDAQIAPADVGGYTPGELTALHAEIKRRAEAMNDG